MLYIIFIAILALAGLIVYSLNKPDKSEKVIGELESQLDISLKEKERLSGENSELRTQTALNNERNAAFQSEKKELLTRLAQFEAERSRIEKEKIDAINKLNTSTQIFEKERDRLVHMDEQRRLAEIAERDRIWNEHEQRVVAQLTELCRLPEYSFTFFDNANLPEGFDGSIKPDFMIEFLNQYVIFDAKTSKRESIYEYIADNVKKTAKKYKSRHDIYSSIFFVVPDDALKQMSNKKTYFYEDGFQFYVITIAAIPVVLSTLRKISSYELAEKLSPEDRENIVNLIAEFDYHINLRNAFDVLAIESGVNVLEKSSKMKENFKDEIDMKKSRIRLESFSPNAIKKLLDTGEQNARVHKLIEPKASIPKETLVRLKSESK